VTGHQATYASTSLTVARPQLFKLAALREPRQRLVGAVPRVTAWTVQLLEPAYGIGIGI